LDARQGSSAIKIVWGQRLKMVTFEALERRKKFDFIQSDRC
jgi:hypothetical protein